MYYREKKEIREIQKVLLRKIESFVIKMWWTRVKSVQSEIFTTDIETSFISNIDLQ